MDAQRMHALACLYAREKTEARLEEALEGLLESMRNPRPADSWQEMGHA